jgi:23S rRNA pseudouridine1911/1915/1917 synthase
MAVVAGGREAHTSYCVIKPLKNYTLVEAITRTGRTHQIRVHFSSVGYPVVGDVVYGVRSPYLERQFLHACLLGFSLPGTGEWVEFYSELPVDLELALERLAGS